MWRERGLGGVRNGLLRERMLQRLERRRVLEREVDAFVSLDEDEDAGRVVRRRAAIKREPVRIHEARGGGVRRDAVAALVRHADGDVDHLLGQRIERARSHDLLDRFPGALQRDRIVGQHLSEIVDPVGLARRHDVVVNGAHLGTGVCVFDRRLA